MNDTDGYETWMARGIEQLGREVAGEVESDWIAPLSVEEGRDRLMAWQLGVSLYPDWGISQQQRPPAWGIHWVNGDEVTQILSSSGG